MNERDLAFLHAHGIATRPEDLDAALVAAIETLPAEVQGESERELTGPETDALRAGGFDLAGRERQGLGPLAKTAVAFAALIATSLTTSQAAARLGLDTSRLRQRLAEGTLYGFRKEGEWLIPEFQFLSEGDLLPNLGEAVRGLSPDLHPVAVKQFFLTAHPDLVPAGLDDPVSPRAWLIAGYPAVAIARLAADL